MKKSLSKRINIFLSVDENSIPRYFNQHDPAPIYERQSGHEFEEYIQNSVLGTYFLRIANDSQTFSYKFIRE